MRYLVLPALLLALAAPAAPAATRSSGGSLSVEGGNGTVEVRGRGALVGRLERGSLLIVDLSPRDQWSPRVNGVPRGKLVGTKGQKIGFYIPGGRYRIVIRGEGISISARGAGLATIEGEPDAAGETGVFAVGDAAPEPLPTELLRVPFGGLEVSSALSARIAP